MASDFHRVTGRYSPAAMDRAILRDRAKLPARMRAEVEAKVRARARHPGRARAKHAAADRDAAHAS